MKWKMAGVVATGWALGLCQMYILSSIDSLLLAATVGAAFSIPLIAVIKKASKEFHDV